MARKKMLQNCSESFETKEMTHDKLGSLRFGERLKKAMGNKSIRKFATELGLPSTTLHQYLIGKTEPPRKNLVLIARHANVNLEWLLTGEGEMTSDDGVYPETIDEDTDTLAAIHILVNLVLKERSLQLDNDKVFKIVMLVYADARRRKNHVSKKYIEDLVFLASDKKTDPQKTEISAA